MATTSDSLIGRTTCPTPFTRMTISAWPGIENPSSIATAPSTSAAIVGGQRKPRRFGRVEPGTVGADDATGTARLSRSHQHRPPLSLKRMSWDADGSVLYRRKARGRFGGTQTSFDAMDFLARLLMHDGAA